ncbi:MAG: GNAT family N-acetyltransferase [Acidobacteria bacterium]|nr:GNAT family N-acetyltransferase [Acidobacteriota bacterium]
MPPVSEYRIEPLGPSHDRTAFHSGVAELDDYLHHQAGQDSKRKVAAPFVMVDAGGSILGYYTLSAYGIRLSALPEGISKRLPRYPLIPATLLGRLAVSSAHQGQKLGRFLLTDALHRSWRNTTEVASVGVVVDALDERARAFYLHHEFIPLLDHPNRLFLAMATVGRAFKAR